MPGRILLRGGLVADGIGATTRRADVLVEGERIAEVRDAALEGASPAAAPDILAERSVHGPGQVSEEIVLPPGSILLPGFIDAHVHAEGVLLAHGRVDGALAQGVTTLVVGQDGQSWIGATAPTLEYLNRYFGPVNGPLDGTADGPLGVAGYQAAVAGRLAQNVAVLASQGTIRHNVAGLSAGPLDPGQRAAARRQVEDALAQGAAGLSSGLDYLPSRFGGVAEVAELARPPARAGRPPGEWTLDLLARSGLQVGAHLDRLALTGDDLAWLARHERHSAGSDGIYQGQHPHPRGYGAFARLAGCYLAGDPGPGYQAVARHLAARAAGTFGLRDRGRIAPGLAADLCVIAPPGLAEQATYADPAVPATGVHLVMVNGTVVWRDGAFVPGSRPGRLVS